MGISVYNASAGSGKTHLLTHLLSDLIMGKEESIEKINPSRVIATTFTKSAAQEIRERASEVLLEKGMIEESFKLKDGLLGTVNSVCGALLERYSVFTKISPEIRVIEETERESLLNSFIGQVLTNSLINRARAIGWEDNYYTGDILLSNLNRTVDLIRYNNVKFNTREDVVALVQESFSNNYENRLTNTTCAEELQTSTNNLLLNLLQDGKAWVSANETGCVGVNNSVVSKIQRKYIGSPLSSYLNYQFKILSSISKNAPQGFKSNFELEHNISLESLVEELTFSEARKNELIEFAVEFFEATLRILKFYQKHKKNEGLIDFADQEFLFLELLQNDFVKNDITQSFDIVFVDEFQDTSPIQLAIFIELNKLIKHSVWIGDPKQSIYGFRGADSGLIKEILSSVSSKKSLQGVLKQRKDQLKTSYRSREELVNFSNSLFHDVFDDVAPENVTLQPLANRSTYRDSCELHVWEQPAAPRKTVISPGALASKIKETIQSEKLKFVPKNKNEARVLKPGDICVLTRTNSSVSELASELSYQGIKVNAPIAGLIMQPEVFSLIAALKLIQNPSDKLSKLEVLTVGHSFGNPEDALEVLNNDEDNENELLEIIDEIRQNARIQSISTQIEVLLSTTYFTSRIKGLKNEFQALANIKALKQNANKYESYCENNGFVTDNFGFELYLKQNNPAQGFALNEECVNIMTYHGAKGLEFPMVVMFDLQKEIKPNFGVTPYSKEAFDPFFPLKNRSLDILLDDELLKESVRQEMLEKQVDENKRLMYVGITRARDFLVIPYREKKKSEDNSQINLLATAVEDKIRYKELTELPLGKSMFRIGDKSFNLLKSKLEELPMLAKGKNEIFVSTPNLSFEKSGKKRKLIGSGKDKIFESPAFSGFQSETIDFKIPLLDDSMKLSDSDFGNVVHNLFQQVGKNNPDHVSKIIKKWELESVLGNGEAFFNSYKNLCSSVEKRFSKIVDSAFEKSFWFKRNEQELDGIIDLVLLTEKGWVIVDYKSHSNADTDLVKFSFSKEYLTQLNNYSEALNNYKNFPVIGTGLYYPFLGEILWTTNN